MNALPRSHQILKEAETAAESYQSPVQKLRENKENQKKELVAKISELSQKGMTVAEIAKTLNVPYSKVHYISRSKKEINQNLTYNVKKSHKNDRTRQDRQDSPAQELLQETLGLVSDRTDGAVLRVLKIESIRPFFMNPVKWCDPLKLKKYMCLWESGANFPPIEVVEQLPEQLKGFDAGRAAELFGEAMAKQLDEQRDLIVMDGHHRWLSAYLIGKHTITAWVTVNA